MLGLGEDGVARAWHEGSEEVLIADFVAVPYGDVVFCVGPDDDAWPRDLDLLAGLWKTAEPPVAAEGETSLPSDAAAAESTSQRKAVKAAGIALACTAVVGGLLTAALLLAGTQPSQAANVTMDLNGMSKQLTQALKQAGYTDLAASPHQQQIVVTGIVKTADDGAAAQRIIDRLVKDKAIRQYDVADQEADDIEQSLSGTGAEVQYSGNGVFRVSGTVPSLTQFHQLLADVRSDLDANVKRLDVQVKEAKASAPKIDYSEMVQVGGLRYIETPDGTKHLYDGASGADE